MTWAVVSIILISLVKILMTCLPSGVVNWLMSKFQIHSKLSAADVTITFDGYNIEDEDKTQIIHSFNEAIFMKQQYIYPGTEDLYLNPENADTPLVIDTKSGKLFVYTYDDHVDVVKQSKKKVIAYSLFSDYLQKRSLLLTGDVS
ncbi:YfmQ family protein [Paenibacillus sp. BSR1-1]|uniref:YfmQ family protein n=1 Tax=Paenibacillus sp. BSR1-1 TaxID=3020845 RepID=UPI0025B243CB|nr:YfmQ family protein [Paenibacillus sp. BSR1-1]MDN3019152.1 YfmQ family protein [Paenibacillus sp. BSR1-1]